MDNQHFHIHKCEHDEQTCLCNTCKKDCYDCCLNKGGGIIYGYWELPSCPIMLCLDYEGEDDQNGSHQ